LGDCSHLSARSVLVYQRKISAYSAFP